MAKCISTHLNQEGEVTSRIWLITANIGQLSFCRMCIVSRQWRTGSFKPSTATFARPIAGVSCLRAERRPQQAHLTLRYGAKRLMACMCLAASYGAAGSSCATATWDAQRAAAFHGFAEVPSTTFICMMPRRKEDVF